MLADQKYDPDAGRKCAMLTRLTVKIGYEISFARRHLYKPSPCDSWRAFGLIYWH